MIHFTFILLFFHCYYYFKFILATRNAEVVSTTGTETIRDIPSDTISEVIFTLTTNHIPDSEFNQFGALGLFKGGVVGYFHANLSDVLKYGEISRSRVDQIVIKVHGNKEMIVCIHQRLQTLKIEHRKRKIQWSFKSEVNNKNISLERRLKKFSKV